MIRIVTEQELRHLVNHDNAFDAVTTGLRRLAAAEVSTPDEIALHAEPKGEIHVKGAHIEGSAWIVFKVASGSFPEAPNAGCSLILSAATGAPVAVFDDGGWLTEMRTAAAGAIAADTLAIDGPLRVAILGTGVQAGFQLEALRARREVTAVHLWGRTPAKASAFADQVGGVAFASVAEAVRDVDIIVTTTSATSPILHGADLHPGVHITAMGSDTVGKRELGPEVLDAATVIAADDVEICGRVGELQHAPSHVGRSSSLASIVAGASAGRTTPTDITVADLCGIGTYDAAIAGIAADQLL